MCVFTSPARRGRGGGGEWSHTLAYATGTVLPGYGMFDNGAGERYVLGGRFFEKGRCEWEATCDGLGEERDWWREWLRE